MLACNSDCDSTDHWSAHRLLKNPANGLALALTSAGEPRIAAFSNFDANNRYIAYIECNLDCSQETLWPFYNARLCPLCEHADGWFSLKLDEQDRPRLAFYTGASNTVQNSPLDDDTLYCAWCDSDCTNQNAQNWQLTRPNVPAGKSGDVDLTLDRAGQPHLAYRRGAEGLGYVRCTAISVSKQRSQAG